MNMQTIAVRTNEGLISAWKADGSDTINLRFFDRADTGGLKAQWSDVMWADLSLTTDVTLFDWLKRRFAFSTAWIGCPIPRAEFARV